MESYFIKIENFIINKQLNDYPEELQDKVIYLLQGGKRLRPILCILFSGLDSPLDNTKDIIYTIAYCIETLHCLSLVLDDLPEMDNDILRRGVESFHIKYGSDYTNFFIYYILNRIGLSMNIVLDIEEENEDNEDNDSADESLLDFKIDIANQIHKLFTSNLNMLIDGQYNDLELGHTVSDSNSNDNTMVDMNNLFLDEKLVILSLLDYDSIIKLLALEKNNNLEAEYDTECDEEWNLDFDILFDATIDKINININLNMKKTSSLFNLSVCTGYLLQLWAKNIHINTPPHANTHNDTILNKLNIWSNVLGYMFQISDDILDIDSDKEKGNPNICTIIGKENTYSLLVKGCEWLNNMIIEINEECRDKECVDTEDINNNIDFNLDIIKQIIEKILKRVE